MAELLKILWAEAVPALSALARMRWGREVVEVGPPTPLSRLHERVKWGQPAIVIVDLKDVDAEDLKNALERLMAEHPVPVLLVAAPGAQHQVAIAGLAAGALDVVELPPHQSQEFWTRFRRQLDLLIRIRVPPPSKRSRKKAREAAAAKKPDTPLVAIAASLGGPKALRTLLTALPAPFPTPVVICQHITSGFTHDLARWLASETRRPVIEAAETVPLEPGMIYIAPSDAHMVVRPGPVIELDNRPPVGGFRPSCDLLLRSAAEVYGSLAIGAVLTGMGRDGAKGLQAIRLAGGHTLAQDKATSVVFGMPAEAIALGAAEKVLPLEAIADQLARWVKR